MSLLQGFHPVANADSRILVLGSMPGAISLQAGEYYAHPRNVFWRIMGDLLGLPLELLYPKRLESLLAARIALWDVMAACERPGSLDADIVPASIQANDFLAFFAVHRKIDGVFFNGAAAERCFRSQVLPVLAGHRFRLSCLPSTSPAHAARSYAEKLAAWRQILDLPKK